MPRGDRTGPEGMGPMTGRAAGFCAGFSVPGFANTARGYGSFGFARGFNRGLGRGRRFGTVANQYGGGANFDNPPPQELDGLRSQAKYLEGALDEIKNRIEELEKSK